MSAIAGTCAATADGCSAAVVTLLSHPGEAAPRHFSTGPLKHPLHLPSSADRCGRSYDHSGLRAIKGLWGRGAGKATFFRKGFPRKSRYSSVPPSVAATRSTLSPTSYYRLMLLGASLPRAVARISSNPSHHPFRPHYPSLNQTIPTPPRGNSPKSAQDFCTLSCSYPAHSILHRCDHPELCIRHYDTAAERARRRTVPPYGSTALLHMTIRIAARPLHGPAVLPRHD